MAVVVNPAAGEPPPAGNPPPAPDPQATNGEHASKAELEALSASFAKQTQALSALVGGMQNELKRLRATEPAAKTDAEPEGERLSLVKLKAELDQQRAETLDAAKYATLCAALGKNGVPAGNLDAIAEFVGWKYRDQIKVESLGKGKFATHFENEDGTRDKLSEWIPAFLQTPEGAIYVPAPSGPSGPGLHDGRPSRPANQPHPYVALSIEQIMEKRETDPAGFTEYTASCQEDWVAKSSTWRPK